MCLLSFQWSDYLRVVIVLSLLGGREELIFLRTTLILIPIYLWQIPHNRQTKKLCMARRGGWYQAKFGIALWD